MSTNKPTPVSSKLCTLGLTMLLTLVGINVSAETFRSGDSTASIEQSGGIHRSRSHVTRFEDGHCIVTWDGRNTDVIIQRNSTPPPGANGGLCEDDMRIHRRDLEERFSWRDRIVDDATVPKESSRLQQGFLQRMIERLDRHFLPYR